MRTGVDWVLGINQKKAKKRRIFSSGGPKRKIKLNKSKLWLYAVGLAFFGLTFSFFLMIFLFAWYAKDLPSPDKVVRNEGFATRIYDRNGELIYDVFKEAKRIPVPLEEIPEYLKRATIAIEDKEFYTHPGFSLKGIVRAVFNIIVRHKLQGGSTLTQQLVKNVLLTSERNLPRKIKEFILALQIERKYSKDQILQMYLNEAPYGGTAWGIGAASEQYFDKKARDLSLAESAILAGLPQRPSVYSPFGKDPTAYVGRTENVLRRMREDGYIDKETEEKTLAEVKEISFKTFKAMINAPHFVMEVKSRLEERYGEQIVEQGGIKVTSSLDLAFQQKVEEIVKQEIEKVKNLNITNAAVLVMDPRTGEILAYVGSVDYFADNSWGKFDVISQALRQPGSMIKPVTYLTAFQQGYTPATMLMDTETTFPGGTGQKDYQPVNYDGEFHGPMQIRYALGNSINIVAVKTLAKVGLKNMLETAYKMGISTLEPTTENLRRLGLSVTLGGGEVKMIEIASAYSAFANSGYKVSPMAILKIEERDGEALEEFRVSEGTRVIAEEEAFLINNILSDNGARAITFGENSALNIAGYQVAAKTGTTNDKRDNWTIGWTPNLLVAVWVGNNDNSPMKQLASGISGAAPIWRKVMLEALPKRAKENFAMPGGIVSAEVDSVSGYKSHDGFASRMEYFIRGNEPEGNDLIHQKLKICRGRVGLATPADIARGDYEEKEFFIFKEEDPISNDGINRWQPGIDKWLEAMTEEKYHPPTEYCAGGSNIEVGIDSPAHESTVGNNFMVKLKIVSLKALDYVKVYVNGEEKFEVRAKPYERDLYLSDGTYTIKAVAVDKEGNQAEREAKIGVNLPWNWQPSPSPLPTVIVTPIPSLTPTLTPIPTVVP